MSSLNWTARPTDVAAPRKNACAAATYVVTAAFALVAFLASQIDLQFTLLCIAVVFGWSEMDGLCGSSHVCTVASVRTVQPNGTWLRVAWAYLVCGTVTAALVGLALGAIGKLLLAHYAHTALVGIVAISVVLVARELGLVRFNLPQVRRQTIKAWAFEFGHVIAGGMWGAHIGLGFATVIRHGGFYVLVAFALVFGPLFGAAIMSSYWIGRALPLFLAPVLERSCTDNESLVDHIRFAGAAYKQSAAIGLAGAAVISLALIASMGLH